MKTLSLRPGGICFGNSPQTDLNLLMTIIVSNGLPYGRRSKPGGTASVSADSAFACDPELAFVESVSPDSQLIFSVSIGDSSVKKAVFRVSVRHWEKRRVSKNF
jgi:hypothetical protein